MKSLKHILALTSFAHLGSQLNAVIQIQTFTLETADIFALGTSDGDSSQFISADFEDMEFVFDQFDPALGILNSATFNWSYSHTYSVTSSSSVTSDDSDAFDVYAVMTYGIDYRVDGTDFFGGLGYIEHTSNTADETVVNTLMFTDTLDVTGFFPSSIQGTGTFDFKIDLRDAASSHFRVNGYFTNFSVQRDAGAFVSITYDYTPVPEPSTYAVILGATALLFVALKKRM